MPHFDGGGLLLSVWSVGVGGSAVALTCILLERYAGGRYGRILTATAGLFLSACGAYLAATGQPVRGWAPVVTLGFLSLAAWAAYSPAFLRLTRRLTSPRVIWVLLLVASPVYATYVVSSSLNESALPADWYDQVIISRDEIPGIRAMTDQGREIKLYRFVLSDEAEEAERGWIAEGRLERHIIQTAEVDPASNCHGWVFTGGRYAIHPDGVETILNDNGYERAPSPRKGDLIVYRNDPGMIMHTGLVLEVVSENLVLIESKWGPLGRYLHPPEYQPYGTNFAYYRSPRQGHQLPVVRAADTPSASVRRGCNEILVDD